MYKPVHKFLSGCPYCVAGPLRTHRTYTYKIRSKVLKNLSMRKILKSRDKG
jgi:hypothetical protein